MEAEVALYWRTVCRHLQDEAQVSLRLFQKFSGLLYFHCHTFSFILRVGGSVVD